MEYYSANKKLNLEINEWTRKTNHPERGNSDAERQCIHIYMWRLAVKTSINKLQSI